MVMHRGPRRSASPVNRVNNWNENVDLKTLGETRKQREKERKEETRSNFTWFLGFRPWLLLLHWCRVQPVTDAGRRS